MSLFETLGLWDRVVDKTLHNENNLKKLKSGLYHYTNLQGLIGIIESQKLWATESSFLADYSEINYGITVAQNIIKNYKSKTKKKAIQKFLNCLSDRILFNDSELYIACFSEEEDLLSQWKGYGNFGEGFSIEFDTQKLFRKERKFPYCKIGLEKVIYDEVEQTNIIASEIDYTIGYLIKIVLEHPSIEEDIIKEASLATADFIKYNLLRFKDKAFSEEKEWRVFYLNSERSEEKRQEVCFRLSENMIIPYMKLDLGESAGKEEWKLPIKKIIIGSKLDTKLTEKSISIMCKQQKIELINFCQSRISLR